MLKNVYLAKLAHDLKDFRQELYIYMFNLFLRGLLLSC